MSIPTSAELELLRTRPHTTRLWLSIYQPSIVLACQVDDITLAKGDMTIGYGAVSAGSYLNVWDDMTMYIGTSPNACDKGKIRIRSITATDIHVAENDDIEWTNGDYLTIVRYIEPWSVYPRIVQNPSNPTHVIFYKDYDIAYTNQNLILGSFVNMGCDYAGFLDTATGTTQVYYSSSGTYPLITGTTLSYAWFFQGGTPTGSNDAIPGYISYGVPGQFVTSLMVSGSNGSVETSYRYVSIYDRPENGTNVPILQWELTNLSCTRDDGGYNAKIKIHQSVPESSIREGALVVIFAEDWYGDTKQSIGGNSPNRQSIVFVGYILDGSIEYDYATGVIEFGAGGIIEKMKHMPGFVIDVESKTNPNKWFQLVDMDCRRGLYHFLKWHSTVLKCKDFEFRGTDQRIQYFNSARASIFDSLDQFMSSTLVGKAVSDRQSKIWAEVGVEAVEGSTGTFPVNMYMNRQDWMNSITFDEVNDAPLSYLEMGGISFNLSHSPTKGALLACAPGESPGYEGNLERVEGLALEDQTQLNVLVANIYAYRNAKYPRVSINMAGDYRNIDIAPQELLGVSTDATDTPRNTVWNNKLFHPTEITWQYLPDKYSFYPSITVHEITDGMFSVGETIIIPVEPPGDDDIPIEPPIPPEPPIIIPPSGSTVTPDIVFVVGARTISGTGTADANIGMTLAKTFNFTDTSPTWVNMLPTNVSGTFRDYYPLPQNPGYAGYYLTEYGLWYLIGLNGSGTSNVTAMNLVNTSEMFALADAESPYGVESLYNIHRVIASPIDILSTVFVLASYHVHNLPNAQNRGFLFRCHRAVGNVWECRMIYETVSGADSKGARGPGDGGIALSQYTGNFVYVQDKIQNIWKSTNTGDTFTKEYDFGGDANCGSIDVHMPRNSGLGDNTLYCAFGSATEAVHVKRTADRFATAPTDITPAYSGDDYGGGNVRSYRKRKIHSCSSYPNNIAILATKIGVGTSQTVLLFTSPDSGANWTMRKNFGVCGGGGLIIHPIDPTKMYLMGDDVNGDGSILLSEDTGVTWTDKVGNWVSIFAVEPTYRTHFVGDNYLAGLIFPIF